MKPTFLDFYLFEDLASEVLALQSQISQIEAKKAKTDKPVEDNLTRLHQQLAIKQKQLALQSKNTTQQQSQNQQQQNTAQNNQNANQQINNVQSR